MVRVRDKRGFHLFNIDSENLLVGDILKCKDNNEDVYRIVGREVHKSKVDTKDVYSKDMRVNFLTYIVEKVIIE